MERPVVILENAYFAALQEEQTIDTCLPPWLILHPQRHDREGLISWRPSCGAAVLISLPFNILFWFAGLEDFQRLSRIVYHEWGYFTFPIEFGQPALWAMRSLYTVLFITSTTIVVRSMVLGRGVWRGSIALAGDVCGLYRSLLKTPGDETPRMWWIALGLLTAILLLRVYFMLTFPFIPDEVASNDFFVSQGWLAVTSFYPIPNNHILFNAVCRIFHLVHPDLHWTMRLPSLIFGAMATLLVFLILRRHHGTLVASLSTALFSTSYYGIHAHFAGRGYSLSFLLMVMAFFALVRAMRTRDPPGWTWIIFTGASVAGMYTVPTYLYAFTSMLAIAGFMFFLNRRWADVARLATCAVITIAFTTLLYLPVMAVSGIDALIANHYLAPMPMQVALSRFADHIIQMENILGGISRVPLAFAFVAPLLVVWALVSHRHKDKDLVLLGWACAAMVLLPYLIGLVQRVHPPERVYYFKHLFLMLLFALVCSMLFERFKLSQAVGMLMLLPVIPYAIDQGTKLPAWGALVEAEIDPIRDLHGTILETRPAKVQVHHSLAQFYLLHYARKQQLQVQFFSDHAWRDDVDLFVTERDEAGRPVQVDSTLYEVKHANEKFVAFGRRKD